VGVDVAEALGVPVAGVVLGRPVSAVWNVVEGERFGTRAGAHVADRRAHLLAEAQRELAVVLALWRLTWVASEPIGHLTLRYPRRSAPNLPRPATFQRRSRRTRRASRGVDAARTVTTASAVQTSGSDAERSSSAWPRYVAAAVIGRLPRTEVQA